MRQLFVAATALAIAAPAFAQQAGDMKSMPGMSGAYDTDHASMTMAGSVQLTAIQPN
jgi:hypothetical protein